MKKPTQITGEIGAWVSGNSRLDSFRRYRAQGDVRAAINEISLSSGDMTEYGWIRIGTAQVCLTVVSDDHVVASQVAALNAELAAVRSAFAKKQAEILERLSKLQALEFSRSDV